MPWMHTPHPAAMAFLTHGIGTPDMPAIGPVLLYACWVLRRDPAKLEEALDYAKKSLAARLKHR